MIGIPILLDRASVTDAVADYILQVGRVTTRARP
jgi:hypothetical protein